MKKKSFLLRLFSIALIAVLISSCLFVGSYAKEKSFVSRYSQVQYTEKNGLPDNSINDILATSDGIMWFASASGLIKYNSKSFQLINKNISNDFGAVNAVKLFEDSQKRLWVGTSDGGIICKLKDGTKTINTKSGVLSNSIRDIKELSTGVIVAATANGIFYIDKDFNVTSVDIPAESTDGTSNPSSILMFCVNLDDDILGITSSGSLFSIIDGKFTAYQSLLEGYKLTCAYLIENNKFRIGTTSGDVIDLTYIDGTDYSTNIIKTSLGSISSMYKDSEERWWVLTDNNVGYIDKSNSFTLVNNLYTNKYIDAMYEDYQGNYWFGSENYGVLKLSKSSFLNYNNEYSLKKFLATAVESFDGKTYIASDSDLKIINESTGEQINNPLTELLKNTKITTLAADSNNNIWIGSLSKGIIRYNRDGAIKSFTTAEGIAGSEIYNVFQRKNGDMVVGTNDGISIIRGNQVIKSYSYSDKMDVSVSSIYEDAQSSLYIGTVSNGAFKIDVNDKITHYGEAEGLPAGIISSIAKDPVNDGVWAAIGISLCYITPDGKLSTIEKIDTSRNIVDIFFAPDNSMWVITPSETLVLDSKNLLSETDPLTVFRMNKSNGLSSNVYQYSDNYMSPEGILYLCCDEGINIINTLDYKISQPLPKISLNTIATENTIYPTEGTINIPSSATQLSFSVSVLSYSEYTDCKLSYMLEGVDSAPIVISTDSANIITYSNLKGGKYKFKMRAISGGHEVGQEISVDIIKDLSYNEKAPFKASMWFLLFLFLLLLLSFLMFLRARSSNKKKNEFKQFTDQSITAISKVVDAKDSYTKGHSERVAKYSAEVAKRYGLKTKRVEDVYYSALLHDIGKIGIPDYILKKPRSLTDEEFEIMKTHTAIGAEILSTVNAIDGIANGARDHHEKFNGTGYPKGLKGMKISLEGRIIGAADAYDAMASERRYSKAIDKKDIAEEIQREKGEQFDPRMADIIIQMIQDGYFDNQDDKK